MVNQKIQDRLAALRAVMKENGVDWYMVPTADFHNSEYVDAYFKVREYLCNFSGSNGTLIVGMDEAGLWTDGRYFIQARAGAYRNRSYFIPDAGGQRSDEGRIFTAEDGKRVKHLALMVVSSIRDLV